MGSGWGSARGALRAGVPPGLAAGPSPEGLRCPVLGRVPAALCAPGLSPGARMLQPCSQQCRRCPRALLQPLVVCCGAGGADGCGTACSLSEG